MRTSYKFKSGLLVVATASVLLISYVMHAPTTHAQGPKSSRTYLPLILGSGSLVSSGPEWLDEINAMRALANLPPVTDNPTWDVGDNHHSIYMVKNHMIGHSETPGNAWYTADGNTAAGNGNVMGTTDVNATDTFAVDLWMKGPFHAIGMLDPRLQHSAYGSYREATGNFPEMAATLDVLRGLGSLPPGVTFPIEWPGNGTTSPFALIGSGESPDPLTSCSGFSYPAGMPVYLQIGPGNVTPSVTGYSFKRGSITQSVCEFDETNYSNPDSSSQSLGRGILHSRSAIVLIPQSPLTAGASYIASVTTNGSTYTWSFTVSSSPRAPVRSIQTDIR